MALDDFDLEPTEAELAEIEAENDDLWSDEQLALLNVLVRTTRIHQH